MNTENMKKLIALMESLSDERIDMSNWARDRRGLSATSTWECRAILHECGSVGCIAGWASTLIPDKEAKKRHVDNDVCRWLDLDPNEANSLFMGDWSPKLMRDITRTDIIDHLKSLLQKEISQ